MPLSATQKQKLLEICFIMDLTDSMGSYIRPVKNSLQQIVAQLSTLSNRFTVQLRIGIVAYRDHSDKDILETFDFTGDIAVASQNITKLRDMGGGDYPEAVVDGFCAAADFHWTDDAYHFMILIGDAPPHGYNNDGTPNPKDHCKCQRDFFQEFHRVRQRHKIISVYTIACRKKIEPLWARIANEGKGIMFPLKQASEVAKKIEEMLMNMVQIMDMDQFIIEQIEQTMVVDQSQLAQSATYFYGRPINAAQITDRLAWLRETRKLQPLLDKIRIAGQTGRPPVNLSYTSAQPQATHLPPKMTTSSSSSGLTPTIKPSTPIAMGNTLTVKPQGAQPFSIQKPIQAQLLSPSNQLLQPIQATNETPIIIGQANIPAHIPGWDTLRDRHFQLQILTDKQVQITAYESGNTAAATYIGNNYQLQPLSKGVPAMFDMPIVVQLNSTLLIGFFW